MKSQNRAWLLTIILFLTWHRVYTGPFTYFADIIAAGLTIATRTLRIPQQPALLLIYFFMGILTSVFLYLGKRQFRLYLAGFFALAILAVNLFSCLKNNRIYEVSIPIVIVLALALVFLLIKDKTPGLFLADAFIVSLPVWLLYDGFLPLIFSLFSKATGQWSAFLILPEAPLVMALDGLFKIPWQVFVIIPTAVALIPLFVFAPNRAK